MLTKLTIASGFGQHEGIWNGNLELKEILKQEFDDYSRREVDIQLYPWNANWKWIARQYHLERLRYGLSHSQFQILVFAYSWGVGNGLVKFAKHLNRYGIDIECAVICDGIYRHWYAVGQWRAMLGGYSIKFPTKRNGTPVIKSVKGFYQQETRPMGQKPVTVAPLEWTQLDYPHTEMDDAPEWHLECLKTARQFIQSATQKAVPVPLSEAPASMEMLESKLAQEKEPS